MTIVSNATYDSYNVTGSKQPVYYLTMSGSSDTFSTHALGSMKAYLFDVGGYSEKITPEAGQSSIGNISYSLLDTDGDITALFKSSNAMRQNRATLYGGYHGMGASDFIQIWTGLVNNVNKPGLNPRYDITSTDVKQFAKNRIWKDATAAGVTAHGNPITLLLQRLVSTNTAGSNGTYDIGDGQGLAISSAWIDVAEFESIRDMWYPSADFFFRITDPENDAKKFLEDEICKPLGLHLVTKYNGQISLNILNPPLPGSIPTAINETNIEVSGFDLNYNSLINMIKIEFDYQSTGSSDFKTKNYYVDTWSRKNWGEKKPHVIQSKGIHGSNSSEGDHGGDDLVEIIKDRIFRRFSEPKPIIKGKVFLKRGLTEVGDIVAVTHTKLPNIAEGTMGISNQYYEAIQKDTDYKGGKINLSLLGTGYDPSYKYGLISPSSTISVKHSASAITLHSVAGLTAGDVMQAETAANSWGSAAISAIAGAKITLATEITGMAAGNLFQFADWSDQTDNQKYRYLSWCATNPTLHIATASSVNTVNVNTATTFSIGCMVRIEDGNGNLRPRTVTSVVAGALGLKSVLSAASVSGGEIALFAMTAGGTATPYRFI